MAPFQYSPLAEDKRHIRILTVKPTSTWDQIIECELKTVSLDDDNLFFEALSYVWGTSTAPGRILLHGTEHNVTRNLEDALRHLRHSDRPRSLWVDAVCINQDDVVERVAQVLMMADIYKTAVTTLSWLGEASDESDEAVELIRTLGNWTEEHQDDVFEPVQEEPGQTLTGRIEQLGFPLRENNWPAVWRLLNRPYWTRVWIIQELAARGGFGTSSGTFYCGTKQFLRFQYDCVCALILLITQRGPHIRTTSETGTSETFEIDEPMASFLTIRHPPGLRMSQVLAACDDTMGGRNENRHLDWLLRLTRRFKATDPRDKLYAMLGLVDDGSIIEPSYTTSFEEVLTKLVFAHVQKYASLRMLLGNRYGQEPEPAQLGPSWIPELLVDELAPAIGLAPSVENDNRLQASGCRPAVVSFDPALACLSCTGTSIGQISKTIGPFVIEEAIGGGAQNVLDAYASLGHDKVFKELRDFYSGLDDDEQRETFWRTLCLDCEWTSNSDPVTPATTAFASRCNVMFGLGTVPDDFMPGEPDIERYRSYVYPFGTSFMEAMTNRTFLATEDGRMGVGPCLAREGDLVTVVFGASLCLVLRPVDDNRYRLVGDAYIHGAMHGELVRDVEQDGGEVFEIV